MQAIQMYLFFSGNCREAMNFYAGVLSAKLDLMLYGDGPAPCPEGSAGRVMHANLSAEGESLLTASDAPANQPLPVGNNFSLSLNCKSREDQERLFAVLSEGGQVRQPLQDTFWGAHFGMLQDKYGVGWMLSSHAHPAS